MASQASSTMGLAKESQYFGPKYLFTIKELEDNSIAQLGSMEDNSYDKFVERMNEVAAKAGITKPMLGIGIKFKKGAHEFLEEQAYPIIKEQWEIFKKDAKTMCEYAPKVFVIDGSKFKLPI